MRILNRLPFSALVSILISSNIAFANASASETEAPRPTTEMNGPAVMAIAQGIGPEDGVGVGLQTPRWRDFLSLRISLVSTEINSQPNSHISWTDAGLDFQMAFSQDMSFRPYMTLGFSKALGTPLGIHKSELGITSWGFRIGIESRFKVTSPWNDETKKGLFFLEAGPETSNLQRFDGLTVGDGLLVKVGIGQVF